MKIYMHRMLAFASVASSWPGVELRVYSSFDKELVCMCLGAFFFFGLLIRDFNGSLLSGCHGT